MKYLDYIRKIYLPAQDKQFKETIALEVKTNSIMKILKLKVKK